MARISSYEYTIRSGERTIDITVSESDEDPFANVDEYVPQMSMNPVCDDIPSELQCLSKVRSLHKEAAAWDTVSKILNYELPLDHGVTALIALKIYSDYRDLACEDAGGFLRLFFSYIIAYAQNILQANLPDGFKVPSSPDKFFSWDYVTAEDERDLQDSISVSQFSTAFMTSILRDTLKSKGFQPFVDVEDGIDPTGKVTFIKVKYGSTIELLGKNAASIIFS
eukprot:Protomagalhaensia_wolfi_Nauph_80__1625@NODE_2000_length_1249_cov_32_385950_g1566_i0_p1_GENE_NODE_2000_length_1249_cov_32_385950_g1566_i0NODE_2000_length_1249_cov_32_385950_g1566_i0_p1_ORF_typecomplete_len224_score40_75DUF3157/PF11355_8/0_011_NODE_2000_length_1249_cov_32_385950_g1566_i0319990